MTTPTSSDSQTVHVLVNFPLDEPERELIRAVDPRITLDMAMRPKDDNSRAPGGGSTPTPEWVRRDDSELNPLLESAEVLFTFRFPVEWLDVAHALKWIQLSSAGADHVIRSGVFEKRPDALVTTVSGIHEIPISEHVIGYILMFSRSFLGAMRNQAQKQWAGWGMGRLDETAGKTLGIFGYGPIARRIALIGKTLGMRVLVTRRTPTDPDGTVDRYYSDDGLREMLPECDYFLLAAPLTDKTRHTIGARELELMKPSAVLMNISRGGLVDQPALITALQEKRIAGAALDVFDPEPLPADSPLWEMPNVFITPHNAGASPLYNRRATELFCANLRAYLDGKEMRNVVDPERGY